MIAHPGRSIDLEVLALESGLFDTLPPPKPLSGRAVDHHVLRLQSGLFDTLPPPPPLQAMHDSLAPLVEAELRGETPASMYPPARNYVATAVGACVGIALMALGVGLRHREPVAVAAPAVAARPAPTMVLPEILIVGDAPTAAASAPLPAKADTARVPSKMPVTAPRAAAPKSAAPKPAAIENDLAVPVIAAPMPVRDIDQAMAARAIAGAARSAGACVEADEARTTMSASVTFAPSGRATSATITGGPFVGTPTGGCIARSLRGASVAPFSGEPVTVRTTVRIR